jgi:hypothetical protein
VLSYFLAAGQVFICVKDGTLFGRFKRALRRVLIHPGVLQPAIFHEDCEVVRAYADLNSQLKRAVFRSAAVLELGFHLQTLLAKPAQKVNNQEDHQDGAQPDAGAATGAPAAVTVIAATAAKNQYQKDNEN